MIGTVHQDDGIPVHTGDDVLPLARVLLADAALQMKRMLGGLAPGATDQMLCYFKMSGQVTHSD
jgi:hypothetical protein